MPWLTGRVRRLDQLIGLIPANSLASSRESVGTGKFRDGIEPGSGGVYGRSSPRSVAPPQSHCESSGRLSGVKSFSKRSTPAPSPPFETRARGGGRHAGRGPSRLLG